MNVHQRLRPTLLAAAEEAEEDGEVSVGDVAWGMIRMHASDALDDICLDVDEVRQVLSVEG